MKNTIKWSFLCTTFATTILPLPMVLSCSERPQNTDPSKEIPHGEGFEEVKPTTLDINPDLLKPLDYNSLDLPSDFAYGFPYFAYQNALSFLINLCQKLGFGDWVVDNSDQISGVYADQIRETFSWLNFKPEILRTIKDRRQKENPDSKSLWTSLLNPLGDDGNISNRYATSIGLILLPTNISEKGVSNLGIRFNEQESLVNDSAITFDEFASFKDEVQWDLLWNLTTANNFNPKFQNETEFQSWYDGDNPGHAKFALTLPVVKEGESHFTKIFNTPDNFVDIFPKVSQGIVDQLKAAMIVSAHNIKEIVTKQSNLLSLMIATKVAPPNFVTLFKFIADFDWEANKPLIDSKISELNNGSHQLEAVLAFLSGIKNVPSYAYNNEYVERHKTSTSFVVGKTENDPIELIGFGVQKKPDAIADWSKFRWGGSVHKIK